MENKENIKIPTQGRLHHLAIQARDWEVSKHFYKEVLGMKEVGGFQLPHRKVIFLDMGGGELVELFSPATDREYILPEYDNATLVIFHFALAVEDVVGATERCRAAGYEVTIEPKELKLEGIHATLSFIQGPNGERVEFFKDLSK